MLGRYRAELEGSGMPPAEAWALTQRLEERLFGAPFPSPRCPDCGCGDVVELPTGFMCIPEGHRWR